MNNKLSLLTADEAAKFQVFNSYIRSGYRPRWRNCLKSLFSWHNETINIYSHLIPLVFVLIYGGYQSLDMLLNRDSVDGILFSTYIFGMAVMFSCCVVYHTLMPAGGKEANDALSLLDYIGITVLIVTSFFPLLYYRFVCQPGPWVHIYFTCIVAFGVLTGIHLSNPYWLTKIVYSVLRQSQYSKIWHNFVKSEYVECADSSLMDRDEDAAMAARREASTWVRTMLYCCLAALGVFPSIHMFMFTVETPYELNLHLRLYLMYATYGMGVIFYLWKVPERWAPGMFDFIGNSHNIWHIWVAAGAFVHYRTVYLTIMHASTPGAFGCSV